MKGLLIALQESHKEFLQVSLQGYSTLTWHHEHKPQKPRGPMALLGHLGRQPLKDMTFLGTDFETHAIWQGYIEKPGAKDSVARKAPLLHQAKHKEPTGT
jgi:hypothetical protein